MTSPKKIMIDARVVEKQVNHGIACYAFELVHNLIHKYNDSSCEFFILINKNSMLSSVPLPKNIHFIFMKTSWSSLTGQLELLKVIFKYKPKLFHSPSFIVPLLSRIKLIATIHDMNHVALAQNYSFIQKIYYFILAFRLRKNCLILTVSQFSKNEIVKYMKISPSVIHVIYNGISPIFKPKNLFSKEELNSTQQKYNLPEKFIFTVGNNKPHKNLSALVEAYCQNNFPIPLVILSNSYENLIPIAEKHQKTDSLRFLKSIDQQTDMAKIYGLCEFFIFPSLYEGFGFPPLEAAACGVPVLTSSVSSLPEIMGDCAFYFDPYSNQSMSDKMYEVLHMNEKIKQDKIQAGIVQSKKFNWETAVQEILQVYDSNFTF